AEDRRELAPPGGRLDEPPPRRLRRRRPRLARGGRRDLGLPRPRPVGARSDWQILRALARGAAERRGPGRRARSPVLRALVLARLGVSCMKKLIKNVRTDRPYRERPRAPKSHVTWDRATRLSWREACSLSGLVVKGEAMSRVLIIEDDASFREATVLALREAGHEPVVASTEEEAL